MKIQSIGIAAMLLFLLAYCGNQQKATKNVGTYYFSNAGNDQNTGHSEEQAWKNLSRLQEVELKPGDKIMLRRGDVFNGTISITQSGTPDKPIEITAYGEGAKPQLQGAAQNVDIKKHDDSVYTFGSNAEVKNLYIEQNVQLPARYPNAGNYLFADRAEKEMGVLYDKELTEPDDYWKDATLVFRSTDWTYDWITIDGYQNNTFTFDSLKIKYKVRKGYGYFIQNKIELLDTVNEYFYDTQAKQCYFIPDAGFSPQKTDLKAVISNYGIHLADSVSHILINNIHTRYYHKAGILAGGNNLNVVITNCKCDCSDQAGIRFLSKAKQCFIKNCDIQDICGRGISLTNSMQCKLKQNQVKRIGLYPGLGTHGVNGMTGIVVEARDETINSAYLIENFESDSNYVAFNTVDSSGYIGIRVDGQYNLTEKNVVRYPMLQLCDGAGIYCFRHTKNSTFRNNFIYYAQGNNESTSKSHHIIALGLYIDGATDCTIQGNTLVGNVTGMVLNAGSKNHRCTHNVFFGNKRNQLTLPTQKEVFDENHIIKNNTFYCTAPVQYCMIQMYRTEDTDFGVVDSNYYYDPYSAFIIERRWEIKDSLNLIDWQNISGQDKNSRECFFSMEQTDNYKAQLFTNETNKDTTFTLQKKYVNINNKPVTQLTLKPYSSDILFEIINENI